MGKKDKISNLIDNFNDALMETSNRCDDLQDTFHSLKNDYENHADRLLDECCDINTSTEDFENETFEKFASNALVYNDFVDKMSFSKSKLKQINNALANIEDQILIINGLNTELDNLVAEIIDIS